VKRKAARELAATWARHTQEWRDPRQVGSQWREAAQVDPRLLACRVQGTWWQTLERLGVTLVVSREYEHLLMAFSAADRPRVSYHPLPHPSGLAVDPMGSLWVASTRNPNQLFRFGPAQGLLSRSDMPVASTATHPLLPLQSWTFPGCLYLHDLAFVGPHLHGNAVGLNAVVRFDDGRFAPVWWPRSMDSKGAARFAANALQLNSIAAGATLASSYFSASVSRPQRFRPGQLDFPVDGNGVIFSGKTRHPICGGLTRPHSARLIGRQLWVDNSGYGQVGVVEDGRFQEVLALPGWTRGLSVVKDVAFVGISRVLPRFRRYAPGLDARSSRCGIYAFRWKTGEVLGSVVFPAGNQIFGLEALPAARTQGFAFTARPGEAMDAAQALYYAFDAPRRGRGHR